MSDHSPRRTLVRVVVGLLAVPAMLLLGGGVASAAESAPSAVSALPDLGDLTGDLPTGDLTGGLGDTVGGLTDGLPLVGDLLDVETPGTGLLGLLDLTVRL